MKNGLFALKICLAGLLVLVVVQHFPAAQGHGNRHHGTGRPSRRLPPRLTRLHRPTPPRHHRWRGSGQPPTGWHNSHPTGWHHSRPTGWHHSHPSGKHPQPKVVWFLAQFEVTNKRWEKDYENKNSKIYKKLEKDITNVIDSSFAKRLKEVHVKNFKKGKKYVVAVLALSVPTPPPPKHEKKEVMAKRVQMDLKRILYNRLKVDPKSVLVKPMKPKGVTHDKKHKRKHRIFKGVVRLLEVWKESLKDIRSTESEKLTKRLYTQMVKVFGNKLLAFKVDKLRKGSIIVDFQLEFNSNMSDRATDVRTKLAKQIGDGQFGDMKVDKTSLQIDEAAQEPADRHEKFTKEKDRKRRLSLEAKAAIVMVALVLVCLCIFVGIWYFVKRNKVRKQESAVQEFDNPVKFGSPTSEA